LTLDLSVGFGLLLYAFLFLVAGCEFSLFAGVFLYLLDYLALVEAQVIVYFTLAVAAFGL
jgi:hypothetical protein